MDKDDNSDNTVSYIHEDLFPLDYIDSKLPLFLREAAKQVSDKIDKSQLARIPGRCDAVAYTELENKYGTLPELCDNPLESVQAIARDFTSGVPLWRSPYLQYNVGSAVNLAAAALYSLALDLNIYNINSGLAGNALIAEKAVARILSSLAGLDYDKSFGLFTFGGTATNLYALKVATRKVHPRSGVDGVPEKVAFLLTEDAHFSHAVAADWLGVGTNNSIAMSANDDRTSNIDYAEHKMRTILEEGRTLAAIMLNGGTTYDHAVDDVQAFINLRDRIVSEYKLSYRPHVHVDTVIGWAWLMFRDYDFAKNDLGIEGETLENIEKQYNRVKQVKLADSWGVDFHKGVGSCPIPCSVIMMNDKHDFMRLSKSADPRTITHQLAQEFSFDSPSDYTLETSRPGGAPLAALTALHTLGVQGYRSYLAKLVGLALLTKKIIGESSSDIAVCNPHSIGYVTMLRLYPPELANDPRREIEFSSDTAGLASFTKQVNKYMKEFFSWDYEKRMKLHKGVEYSYSSTYIKTPLGIGIPAVKFYPTSPNIKQSHVREAIDVLTTQKTKFDSEAW